MRTLVVALTLALAYTAANAREPLDVFEASIPDLQQALGAGEVSSQDLVRAYLARIDAYNRRGPRLNAVITLNPEALEEAAALDAERRAKGPRGPLHGVPVLVKDNFNTSDMRTSAGSLALATLQPRTDAGQVARLRAAGAIILGKTALHELAGDITNVSSYSGYSRNPYDPDRSPGGSSGGTGAAVAASLAAAGLGSDTCGSIRIPAAYQNLYGLRPTRGLSTRAGVVPLSETQDVAGPLARTVADLALLLDATVGPDPADPSTRDAPPVTPGSYLAGLRPDGLAGARIGVLTDLVGGAPEDQDGAAVFRKALAQMRAAGAEVVDLPRLGFDDMLKDGSVIANEFREDLAAYLAAQEAPPVRSLDDILRLGLDHAQLDARLRDRNAAPGRDSQAYRDGVAKQQATRERILQVLADQRLDALVYPTSLRRPPLIGADSANGGPSCRLSAHSGLPALAIPAGFTDAGLPIGAELLGPAFSEHALLRLASGWEQAAKPRRAPFSTPSLAGTTAPAPTAFVTVARGGEAEARTRFRYDPSTGHLTAETAVSRVRPDDLLAVTLHRMQGDGPGPILAHLVATADTTGAADVKLYESDRRDLAAGRLYVRIYTRAAPLGGAPAPLRVPQQRKER